MRKLIRVAELARKPEAEQWQIELPPGNRVGLGEPHSPVGSGVYLRALSGDVVSDRNVLSVSARYALI